MNATDAGSPTPAKIQVSFARNCNGKAPDFDLGESTFKEMKSCVFNPCSPRPCLL